MNQEQKSKISDRTFYYKWINLISENVSKYIILKHFDEHYLRHSKNNEWDISFLNLINIIRAQMEYKDIENFSYRKLIDKLYKKVWKYKQNFEIDIIKEYEQRYKN